MARGIAIESVCIYTYMLTTWQEELRSKEQSQVTTLSSPFLEDSGRLQFPSPPHGSFLKSQSLFPNFLPISLNALTALSNSPNKKIIKINQVMYNPLFVSRESPEYFSVPFLGTKHIQPSKC